MTHAIDFLDRVDKIIIMNKGEMASMGTYEELKNDAMFQDIIKHVAKAEDENKDESKSEKGDSSDSNEDEGVKNYMSKKGHKTVEHEEDEEFELSYQTYCDYISYCRLSFVFLFIGTLMLVIERYGFVYLEYVQITWVRSFSLTHDPDIQGIFEILVTATLVVSWEY